MSPQMASVETHSLLKAFVTLDCFDVEHPLLNVRKSARQLEMATLLSEPPLQNSFPSLKSKNTIPGFHLCGWVGCV